MAQIENLRSFLTEEFRNSVMHIRHHENLRSRHLAFFFTVLLASIGFFITQLKDFDLENMTHEFFSISLLLILVLSIFGSLILIIVKKQGFAMASHESKIHWIRMFILSEFDLNHDIISGKYSSANPIRSSPLFSVQKSFEYILIGSSLILNILILFIYLKSIGMPFFDFSRNVYILILYVIAFAFQIYLFYKNLDYFNSPYRSSNRAQATSYTGKQANHSS